MLVIQSSAAMRQALTLTVDVTLRALLSQRMMQLTEHDEHDLADIGCFLIVEAGDQLGVVEEALGFSIATNLVDGTPLGHPDFTPSWEWIARHEGWFEAVYILSDDGFATVLLIPEQQGIDPMLLSLCREHAHPN